MYNKVFKKINMNIINSNISNKNNNYTISLEVTHICNFNCWYCYDKKNKLSLKHLCLEKFIPLFETFLLNIEPHKKIDIIIIGGEPTLYKFLNQLLIFLENNIQVRKIIFYSNGHKHEILQEISCFKKIHFIISIHYKEIKNKDLYIENLKKIMQFKNIEFHYILDNKINFLENKSFIERLSFIKLFIQPLNNINYSSEENKLFNNFKEGINVIFENNETIFYEKSYFFNNKNIFQGLFCETMVYTFRINTDCILTSHCYASYKFLSNDMLSFLEKCKVTTCNKDFCTCFPNTPKSNKLENIL